jgi:hypothetical protein
LPVGRIDRVDQRIEDSVSEVLILKFLAEDKGLDQQLDLL